MALFRIDLEKCDKDGICALECPAHIIRMGPEGPVPVSGAEEFCIRCGHCVAVCPNGAFRLAILTPDQCLPLDKACLPGPDQVEHFLRSRRSIRRYKNRPVPRELFEKALSLACCAPSGSNRQPVKWLVVDQKERVGKIAGHVIDWMRFLIEKKPKIAQALNMTILVDQWDKGVDRICRDAPCLVFAHAANEVSSGGADCHTALAYLELALPGFGLGSCWAGYVNYAVAQWPALKRELDLPPGHTCHGALLVGYPRFRYPRAPRRNAPDIRYLAG